MTTSLPLNGVKVIEFGHSVAAPFAGSILAQLGADVVKVEQPGSGDPARDWGPPYREQTAVIFEALNRDKRGIAVDLKNVAERDRLRRLILDEADVVIQNLRPGSIERLDLSADRLLIEKPSLIYCNLSAFGRCGPLKSRPGYDPLMQAYGGLMSVNGEPGRAPVRVGTSIIDMGAGMWSVVAILAALHEREHTGCGGVLDTSLYETALSWMTLPIATYLASGEIPRPLGSAAPQIVPYQIFATADGYLMVAAGNDNLFRRLAIALGRSAWCEDRRYSANGQRVLNREALVTEIGEIMIERATDEWIALFDEAGIPNARPQSVDAVVSDPQTEALGIIESVPSSDRKFVGLPLSFDGVRPSLRMTPPALGADNGLLAETSPAAVLG